MTVRLDKNNTLTTVSGPSLLYADDSLSMVREALNEPSYGDARHAEEMPMEHRNTFRARYAVTALTAYAEATNAVGEPTETLIYDLLVDLHHLCDQFEPTDRWFAVLVERAVQMRNTEQTE